MSHHDYGRKKSEEEKDDDEDEHDAVEEMLKKTGCIQEFYDVQECMGDHRDWRACQDKVKAMRECMAKHEKAVAESKK